MFLKDWVLVKFFEREVPYPKNLAGENPDNMIIFHCGQCKVDSPLWRENECPLRTVYCGHPLWTSDVDCPKCPSIVDLVHARAHTYARVFNIHNHSQIFLPSFTRLAV